MHLTDNEAAQRAADRENRLTEYMRRKRNNFVLNAFLLLSVAIFLGAELTAFLIEKGYL
ncbi:hypothetical protein [Ralstonia pickettii]|uniref:hypothetical protein n=1 Tax=Ralstonia pickettii TaxID=329 RepID=UPI0015F85EB1|nr:hypothetical protein [Ralstonia pickettii]MBX4004305.1 hypothetical protein [Ralstonia pickettii]MBX4028166.1 hypothetical protein [Ralstonia pickettii]MBX4072741.1 hypothetical protein [Ralstonia pickettii]MBX4077698.1 hypothetical protein [Ralstonia pickettii]MBX4090703.1 hypothetical protein [Ralstonia pickettii]